MTKNFLLYSILSSLIIFILISESNTYRPDAGLYHLPYINILHYEKIILGLSNLHFRFGHISIIQYLSAISNNLIFGLNGIVFSAALISSAVIINFIFIFFKKIKINTYDIEFFFIFAILIFISYKLNRYSNYGNDAPAHFLYYFLVSQILAINKNFNFDKYSNTYVLSAFIFMNKITLSIACLITIIFLKKKFLFELIKSKKIIFTIIFISLWFLKNILVSGCLIYPQANTCFEKLYWTDKKTAKYISTETEAWAKNWPDSKLGLNHKEYIDDFNWLSDWKKNYLPKLFKILAPYVLILLLLNFYFRSSGQKRNVVISSKTYLLFIPLGISLIVWFLKFPVFRYGQSFIITILALSFAIYSCRYSIDNNRKNIFYIMIFICFFVFTSKNLLRIHKSPNDYFNYPWPKFYSVHDNNFPTNQTEIIINNKKFFKATKDSNGLCMYSQPLCSGFERSFNTKKFHSYLLLYRSRQN